MRRIRHAVFLILPLLLLVGLAGPVAATGRNAIEIQRDAQYNLQGSELEVGLFVTCRSGTIKGEPGQVVVDVSQSPPETPAPVTFGSGLNNVVCDGKPHYATLSVFGAGFDGGRAHATATLIPPAGGGRTVEVSRDIFIVAN